MEEWIIVGLGNPGAKYELTRHNIGFMVVDELAARHGFELGQDKWQALWQRGRLWDCSINWLKPQTFMNLSGRAVARCADFFKVPQERIVIIHDDLDMAPGRLKLVRGGGAGGHNGIRSLIECFGGRDFYRLKWGIGRPGQGGVPAAMATESYVLGRFQDQELDAFAERADVVEQGLRLLLSGDQGRAQTLINSVR